MQEYSLFAKYHDDIVRPEEGQLEDEIFFLDEVFQDFWNWKNILEAACGSWVILKELKKKGYTGEWFDLSKDMIEKWQLSWVDYIEVWDMTDYKTEEKYDIVLCNYNSICHLKSFEDWIKFWDCSFDNLKSWGILVFDITTIYEFESLVEDFTMSKNFGQNTLCLSVNKNNKKYVRDIRMFEKADDWRYDLTKETVTEVSFEISEIKKELEKRFTIEAIIDYHNIEINEYSERVYFVAKKS